MSKQTAGEILKFDVLFTSVSYMSVYFIKSAVNTLSFQVLKKIREIDFIEKNTRIINFDLLLLGIKKMD